MKKWKLMVGLSAVLICGIVMGIMGTLVYVKKTVNEFMKGDYQKITGFVINRLESKLDLTLDQSARVKQIVESTKEELIHVQPEVDTIIIRAVSQIRSFLTPKQSQQLNELLHRHPRGKIFFRSSPLERSPGVQ